jgi:riboflavin synthase alpha subunit
MATATSVTVRQSNDQFRGIFNETWVVKATLNAGSLSDGAGETDDITVPGVALGDMVLGASLGVDLVGLTVTGYVSAANTVKFRIQNESTATVDLASSTLKIVIGRPTI